jgi:hypothetical protein
MERNGCDRTFHRLAVGYAVSNRTRLPTLSATARAAATAAASSAAADRRSRSGRRGTPAAHDRDRG